MEITNDKKQFYARKLGIARSRILCNHGFYGLLLMHLPFALDESIETAATDGKRIYFCPQFLEGLTTKELDFVLMHEILHVVLRHLNRSKIFDENPMLANIACDIVVNSNILYANGMKYNSITIDGQTFMHLTPNGDEGYFYTAEEVYDMLKDKNNGGKGSGQKNGNSASGGKGGKKDKKKGKSSANSSPSNASGKGLVDDHSKWDSLSEAEKKEVGEKWDTYLRNAIENVKIKGGGKACGNLPLFAERYLKELKKAQTDWRTIITDFVQEDFVDYTFSPPDRRYGDSEFFLPDLNVTFDIRPSNVLFMVDTSGSISDDMISRAYSEIKGAIDQFDGKLKGYLGFFDAAVIPAKPFGDEYTLKSIIPKGGGGTNFHVVFDYVDTLEEKPSSIVILTDGYATFPDESRARDIPVLWVIIGDGVNPPWGKVANVAV